LVFAWDVRPEEKGDKLRPVGSVRSDPGETLRRMLARIGGNREAWEGNPRLDGVTGALPEFLAVEE
jgi:hypothetical protein